MLNQTICPNCNRPVQPYDSNLDNCLLCNKPLHDLYCFRTVPLATDRPVYLDDPDDSQKKKSIKENTISNTGYNSQQEEKGVGPTSLRGREETRHVKPFTTLLCRCKYKYKYKYKFKYKHKHKYNYNYKYKHKYKRVDKKQYRRKIRHNTVWIQMQK